MARHDVLELIKKNPEILVGRYSDYIAFIT